MTAHTFRLAFSSWLACGGDASRSNSMPGAGNTHHPPAPAAPSVERSQQVARYGPEHVLMRPPGPRHRVEHAVNDLPPPVRWQRLDVRQRRRMGQSHGEVTHEATLPPSALGCHGPGLPPLAPTQLRPAGGS